MTVEVELGELEKDWPDFRKDAVEGPDVVHVLSKEFLPLKRHFPVERGSTVNGYGRMEIERAMINRQACTDECP